MCDSVTVKCLLSSHTNTELSELTMKIFKKKLLRMISRKHNPEEEEDPTLRNTLILENIFHFLPLADIKTAALVCRLFLMHICIITIKLDIMTFY